MTRWRRALGLGASVTVVLAVGAPARAQTPGWTLYGTASSSFCMPFVVGGSGDNPARYYARLTLNSLTLNDGANGTSTNPFIVDTGSLGLVAGPAYFRPDPNPSMRNEED